MKIQYASDLHLEFAENAMWIEDNPLEVTGDILVLAGDIILFGNHALEDSDFFDWCSENYKHTFIVPGNHEYYNGFDLQNSFSDFSFAIRPNVTYCNNHSVVVDDTELFFTTLWSRVSVVNEMLVQMKMTDCYRIHNGGRFLMGRDYTRLHQRCVEWLRQALEASHAKHKVVVTHHCPVMAEDPAYKPNGLTEAFITPMEHFIEQHPDITAWIFGHTHYNAANQQKVGATILCTNQLGYVKDGVPPTFTPTAHLTL